MFPTDDEMYRPQEPHFFQFYEYLSVKLADEFMEIIEIDTCTWVVAMIFALGNRFICLMVLAVPAFLFVRSRA